MGFLCSKKLVRIIYTQNIDGLELKSGIDISKIIFAHGNFFSAHCPKCNKDISNDLFIEYVKKEEILKCETCNNACKSKIVFYGENLPQIYYDKIIEMEKADLGIISGTSLQVSPFNQLPTLMKKGRWRLLLNLTLPDNRCFEYYDNQFNFKDEESNDLFLSCYSDDGVWRIVKDCGWEEEFKKFINDTKEDNSKNHK